MAVLTATEWPGIGIEDLYFLRKGFRLFDEFNIAQKDVCGVDIQHLTDIARTECSDGFDFHVVRIVSDCGRGAPSVDIVTRNSIERNFVAFSRYGRPRCHEAWRIGSPNCRVARFTVPACVSANYYL